MVDHPIVTPQPVDGARIELYYSALKRERGFVFECFEKNRTKRKVLREKNIKNRHYFNFASGIRMVAPAFVRQ